MKVLQLIDTLHPGGAERVAINYARMLANEFGISYLVTTRTSGILESELDEKVQYLNLGKTSVFDFNAIKKLTSFLKENDIVIIHAHTTSYFFAALIKLFHPRIRLVWHDHQGNRDEIKVLKQLPLIFSSFLFNGIITVNNRLKSWAKKHLFSKNVIYLENFISDNGLLNGNTKLFGIEGKRIVKLANLRYPKNHLYLLRAFKEVVKHFPDWSLHLVGKDLDDTYSSAIKQYITNNDLEQSVFIYGLRQDVQNILSQCDIGVISSSFEGLPMALLEYGYAELAIISTDVGSCKELIEGKGIIVESNDEVQLENALITFIENEEFRLDSAKKIKIYIDVNFTESIIKNKILQFYNGL